MLFMSMSVFGQPGFIKAYDASVSDKAWFQDMLIDNDTIVLYSIAWDDDGVQGIRFLKMDSLGQVLQAQFFADTTDVLSFTVFRKKIIKTSDGGYAICGGTAKLIADPYLLKVNHQLELEVLKKYPSGKNTAQSSLLEMSDGGFMLLCWEVDGVRQPVVIRTDKNGVELWRKSYISSGVKSSSTTIKKIGDNRYLILANRGELVPFPNPSKWGHGYFIEIDSLGNKNWDYELSGSDGIDVIWDCDVLDDGGMVCVGGSWEEMPSSPGSYTSRPQIFRLDVNYDIIWQHIYSGYYTFQFFRQMVKTSEGNYIASGNIPSGSWDSMKGVHLKFTPAGDELWMRLDSVYPTYNIFWKTEITGTGLLSSGSIISIGSATNATGPYGFMMKLSPNGCIDTLNCWLVATGPAIPDTRQALSVYPNPAADYVVLSKAGGFFRKGAEIQWIDGLGRTIDRVFPQGDKIRMEVAAWPSGIYFYRYLLDGREMDSGRILVDE